jgi:hypothetical protein
MRSQQNIRSHDVKSFDWLVVWQVAGQLREGIISSPWLPSSLEVETKFGLVPGTVYDVGRAPTAH